MNLSLYPLIGLLVLSVNITTTHQSRRVDEQAQPLITFSKGMLNPNAEVCGHTQPDISICLGGVVDRTPRTPPFENAITTIGKAGGASYKSDLKISVSQTTCRAELSFSGNTVGKCGGNNSGGHGRVTPRYSSTLQLSKPSQDGDWYIDIKGLGQNLTGHVVGDFKLVLSNTNQSYSFSWANDGVEHNTKFSKVPPGVYDLAIEYPMMERGCLGSFPGTVADSNFTTEIVFNVYLTDK